MKNEEKNREQQDQYQQLLSIFDSIDEVIYVTDPDTYEVLYGNQALKNIIGDVIGEKCYKSFQGLDSPCPFCTNKKIFGENLGQTYIWEFQNRITKHWYHCIDKAIRWPDGRMVRYEMAIDVTKQKQAEEEFQKSEAKFRKLIVAVPAIIFIYKGSKILYVNPATEQIMGYTRGELLNMNFWDFVHPDFQNIVKERELARQQQKEEVPSHYEIKIVTKDGQERWLDFTANLIEFGEDYFIIGYAHDITESKNEKAALRESEERYRSLVELCPDGVVVHTGGKISFINDAGAKIIGADSPDQLIGKPISDFVHPDYREIVKERVRQMLEENKKAPLIKEKFIRLDGNIIDVEVAAMPILYQAKPSVLVIVRDITKRQ